MLKITLTYSIDESLENFAFDGEKISFGRGSEADLRFDDKGLSRLHATIHREDDQIWIVDENSTNGSFVNGERVSPHGTILYDGDIIKIGNFTKIKVSISEEAEEKKAEETENVSAISPDTPAKTEEKAAAAKSSFGMIPLLITGLAVFVITASAVFIGVKALSGGDSGTTGNVSNDEFEEIEIVQNDDNKTKKTKSEQTSTTDTNDTSSSSSSSPSPTPLPKLPDNPNADKVLVSESKKYKDLSEAEKKQYISVKAERIAQIIGNQKSEPIPPLAIEAIKKDLDGYVGRLNRNKNDDCSQGGWIKSDFRSVLERATKTSPFIIRSFEKENLSPQIGIYVAMIESEHCSCLESNTGAVGMFQFLPRTAEEFGLPVNQRCSPEPSAKASAIYLKYLINFAGTSPESVPLAIASYNSGQGAMRINLEQVLKEKGAQNRSFWTMVENKNLMTSKYSEQFDRENSKYVPKFFAAAIIGENPQDFGVNQKPLSLYR